jgi:transcription termination factor Rho
MKIIDATETLLDRITTTQSNEEFLKLIQTP